MKLTKQQKAMGQFADKMDWEGGLEGFCRYGWGNHLKDLPEEAVAVLKDYERSMKAALKITENWLMYSESEE